MQNLLRRGATYYARLFIPADRWGDVGNALRARSGVKREVVRTLETTDIQQARRRLKPALAAMQAQVDAALVAARKRPLTDWSATWATRAGHLREALRTAGTEPISGQSFIDRDGVEQFVGESERDMLLDSTREEAEQIARQQGPAAAQAFTKAVTTPVLTLNEAAAAWLSEVTPTRRRKTIEGHRRVLTLLEQFLKERHGFLSLASTTLEDVTRRIAGEFIQWRAQAVSAAAVRREFSALMGLWRWAIRRGHTEANPWSDQTAGLSASRNGEEDAGKRPFSTPELVALLRATGDDWSPNRGGYGAALWDAVRLALLSGLRASELANLRIRDLVDGYTVISVPTGKTRNAQRLVPLPRAARDVITARIAALPDTSPDAPLWPEIPTLGLTSSRGNKLSDRFRTARKRLLPGADGVDLHSLRRSYATLLEAAMNAGSRRINPAVIASLIGHARGTLALDRYSPNAGLDALRRAVADMERLGIPREVAAALVETRNQRPRMVRFAPATMEAARTVGALPRRRPRTKSGAGDRFD